MDIVRELASKAICGIYSRLYNEIRSLIHLGRDVHEMQSLFNALQARKRDINNCLQKEGKIPFHVVEDWRVAVDSLQPTADGIIADTALHKRCLAGRCPDCTFRLKLSRRVRDCKSEIQRLFQEGKFEYLNGQFGETPPPPISEDRPVGTVVGKAIEDFQRQIEDWLKEDERSSVIGVYGMGGVGKTTLLRNVNNSAMVQTMFDLVIWVTVSQNPNIRELQNSIARRLGLRLPEDLPEGEGVEDRGVKLYRRLKEKKFLLILDDVWRGFNVETELGASSSEGRGKVILSTRDVGVCRSMMANRILELKPLKDEEGWDLFRRRAFLEDAGDISEIEGIARLVAAECKGLPLAINVVAAAMPRIAEPSAWRIALAQLRAVDKDFYELHGDIDRELFQRLKWSYDALSPNHLKICFLLCAAFPEDTEIPAEELIEYWISEGLVEGRDDEYLIDKGYSFIYALRDRSFIQTTEREAKFSGKLPMTVTVHDVLRDFAIRVGEMDQENKCLFRVGQNVRAFPPEEHTQLCTRISLMQNEISSLPPNFQCRHLVSLVLAKNQGIENIPESFLTNLPSLRMLDLSRTGMRSFPIHLGFPNQLVYLNLSHTDMTELPESVGDLQSLQFLNLSYNRFLKSVSFRLGELKFLRSLNLSQCRKLRVIPRELSGITSLETLHVKGSGVFVGEQSLSGETEIREICVRDFVKFGRLRKLSLQLKSPLRNGVMGKWTRMRHLQLTFGYGCGSRGNFPDDMREMQELEHMEVNRSDIVKVGQCICALDNLQYLSFVSCHSLTELTGLERLPLLKTLRIELCNGLRELGAAFGRAGGFPMLELWILYRLSSLQYLVGECGMLEEGALQRLKYLTICECPQLRSVPSGMEKLQRLEQIRMRTNDWDSIVWVDESIKVQLQKYFVAI